MTSNCFHTDASRPNTANKTTAEMKVCSLKQRNHEVAVDRNIASTSSCRVFSVVSSNTEHFVDSFVAKKLYTN